MPRPAPEDFIHVSLIIRPLTSGRAQRVLRSRAATALCSLAACFLALSRAFAAALLRRRCGGVLFACAPELRLGRGVGRAGFTGLSCNLSVLRPAWVLGGPIEEYGGSWLPEADSRSWRAPTLVSRAAHWCGSATAPTSRPKLSVPFPRISHKLVQVSCWSPFDIHVLSQSQAEWMAIQNSLHPHSLIDFIHLKQIASFTSLDFTSIVAH